jgi:hypothetical protein
MLELALAIVIGLLVWQGVNHLRRRFGVRRLARWSVLTVLGMLLAVIVVVCDVGLLEAASNSHHTDAVIALIIINGFAVVMAAVIVRRRQRLQNEAAEPMKAGWPKETADLIAKDILKWGTEFERKHRRAPSANEGAEWLRSWLKEHAAEMLKPEMTAAVAAHLRAEGLPEMAAGWEAVGEWAQAFERTHGRPPNREEVAAVWDNRIKPLIACDLSAGFKKIGVPKPAAAGDALLAWLEAFERKYGREPSEAEIDNWMRRWRELHEAMDVPKPSAASEALREWSEAFGRKYCREPSEAEIENWTIRWRELHGASPSPQKPQVAPPSVPMVVTYGTGSPEETISLCRFHDRVANHGDVQLIRGFHPGECTFCALGFENIQEPTRQQLQGRINKLP